MLDNQIREQLTSVFGSLEGTIELVYHQSFHEKQTELAEMLVGTQPDGRR